MAQHDGPPKARGARGKGMRVIARGHGEAAIAALAAVMNDASASPAARVSAASTLLTWGFGRPGQPAGEGKGERVRERVVRLGWATSDPT
jgi:hypothetical protein